MIKQTPKHNTHTHTHIHAQLTHSSNTSFLASSNRLCPYLCAQKKVVVLIIWKACPRTNYYQQTHTHTHKTNSLDRSWRNFGFPTRMEDHMAFLVCSEQQGEGKKHPPTHPPRCGRNIFCGVGLCAKGSFSNALSEWRWTRYEDSGGGEGRVINGGLLLELTELMREGTWS